MPKTAKTHIFPWLDVIIVTDPPEDVTEQGVVLLTESEEDKKKKPEKGIVVAKGIISEEHKAMRKLVDEVEIGDMIFYERYTANKIPDAGREYNFVRVRYIMGFKKI